MHACPRFAYNSTAASSLRRMNLTSVTPPLNCVADNTTTASNFLNTKAVPFFCPLVVSQALAERCLSVLVDMSGTVRKVSSPDATLFGFAPDRLLSKSVSSFIDVMGTAGEVDSLKAALRKLPATVCSRAGVE